jgi:hypothetical protein
VLEYNPAPPFQAGSPEGIPAEELQRMLKLMQPRMERRRAATCAAAAGLAAKV